MTSHTLSRPNLGHQFGGLAARVALCLALCLPSTVPAQAVADPFNYTRTSSFTYQPNGMLAGETIEPDNPSSCVKTTYTYDASGNKKGSLTTACAGASAQAYFMPRNPQSTYDGYATRVATEWPSGLFSEIQVTTPNGAFLSRALNALGHVETRETDPKFGVVTRVTGPNGLVTSWRLDAFGRKVLETRADGTKTRVWHCLIVGRTGDTSSNSHDCPAPSSAEIPALALRFEHSVALAADGTTTIAAFTRVYYDRAGRKIRSVTEGFDGANQPGGAARLIVQDTDYDDFGAVQVATQPYFLDSGASTSSGSGGYGMSLTKYDALGRPTEILVADPKGSVAGQTYGARGPVTSSAKTTILYTGLTTTTTDDQGRKRIEEKSPSGKVVRTTDALHAQLVHQYDAFDNLIAATDALGNTVRITYDVAGRKLTLNDPDAGVTTYCNDALGQLKAQQTSAMRGSHAAAACPTALNASTTAPTLAGWTTLAYDVLGRQTHRVEPEYATAWTWDACTMGVGKLCQVATSHGITRKLAYDNLGRPQSTRTDVSGGPSAAGAVSYDASGRLATQRYPSGVQVSYQYTARGALVSLKTDTGLTLAPLPAKVGGTPAAGKTLAAGSLLWQAQAVNAWGKAEAHWAANGVVSRAAFEGPTGRLLQLTAGLASATDVIDLRYTWDSVNQLTQRVDTKGAGDASGIQMTDTYQYDKIGRLTNYVVAGGDSSTVVARTVTLQYNALGLLLYKSDVGNYSYPTQGVANGRPHALAGITGALTGSYGYDLNGNLTSASAGKYRTVSYTSFNLPDSQTGIQGPAGGAKYTWQYDDSHQRIKEVRTSVQGTATVTRTTWYLHPDNQGGLGFECESASTANCSGADTAQRHYLNTGGQILGVLVITGALPSLGVTDTAPAQLASVTAVKLEIWHKDHLGSLVATTDHNGAVTARYAYDPFGKRRYVNASYDAFGALVIDWTSTTNAGTDRGYTGHEHLDDIGLIHMNGRLFDPLVARFMQADPHIQDPLNLQNYDRYQYCYNNPLTCTDPTGYFSLSKLWKQIRPFVAIAVAAFMPEILGYLGGYTSGLVTVEMSTTGVFSYGLSGMGAAVSGFASGAIATGSLKGAIQGAFSAAMFFQAGDLINGQGAFDGVASVAKDPFAQVVVHGVTGCITSMAGGGKCGPGALSAAFSKALVVSGITNAAEPIEGTIKSAIAGGIGSALGGGKFANGALTGAFSYLFNECQHTRMCGTDSTSSVTARAGVAGGFLGNASGLSAWGSSLHFGFDIADGYGTLSIDGGPSDSLCFSDSCRLVAKFDTNRTLPISWSAEMSPPAGMTTADLARAVKSGMLQLSGTQTYSFPSNILQGTFSGGYNSNSIFSSTINEIYGYSTPAYLFLSKAMQKGFQAPGYTRQMPRP